VSTVSELASELFNTAVVLTEPTEEGL